MRGYSFEWFHWMCPISFLIKQWLWLCTLSVAALFPGYCYIVHPRLFCNYKGTCLTDLSSVTKITYQSFVLIFVPVSQNLENLETIHLVVQVPTRIHFLLQTETYCARSSVPHFIENSWSKQYLNLTPYNIAPAGSSLTLRTVITLYYLMWILLRPSDRIPNTVKIITCKLSSSVDGVSCTSECDYGQSSLNSKTASNWRTFYRTFLLQMTSRTGCWSLTNKSRNILAL